MLAEATEVLADGNVRNEQRQATSSSAQGRTARADVFTRASSGSPQQHLSGVTGSGLGRS